MIYFTSDEHYFHKNVIKYCNRPFSSVEEMNETIIERHNNVVKLRDTTIHCGDFMLHGAQLAASIIQRLNGHHIFITGSHDFRWMKGIDKYNLKQIELKGYIYEFKYNMDYIVACHYAMLTWPRSHHNSFQVFGHSHGELTGFKPTQMDVGVDCNNFTPISIESVLDKLKLRQYIYNN